MFSALLLVVLSSAFARADETNLTAPSPRKDSCSFIDQGKLYVLGGSTGTNIPPTPDFSIPKDSFYSLDLSVRVNATSATMTGWKTVTMEGATPVSGHTCVLLPIRVLLVFGTGMKTSSPFLQAFDLKTQRWMPPPQTRFSGNNSSSIDNELSGLYGHTSGLVGHYVVITGGKRDFPANGSSTSRTRTLSPDETTSEPNLDTFVLDVSVGPYWTWTRYPGITSIDGLTPSGRMFATSWVVGGKGDQLPTFYITGGLPVATDDTSNNDVVAPDFDGKSIWKFDPVTGFWEKDLRRTLDVLAVGMTAAVRPGTSTVYFQGGQNPIDGTFITSLRTFDFDESSNGVARIVSGFAKPAAGVSRHVSNFISSTTLAVFGGIANLNSASNEIRFLSVDPPLVASIFDPRATATPKPTTTPDSPPSDSPESEMDSKIVLIAVTTLSLLMLFSMIFLVWATWDRLVDSCTPGTRRGGKLPREKAYFDLENGESTQKLLGNAKTDLEKPAGTADKALPEIPLPTRFAPTALPAVREIIEPSHLYHSVGDGSKWSYPPLPHTAATNRTSTHSSNYTDDIESLMWLENRRSSIRRYSSGRRSSASSDMSDESSAFRSSASYSESAGSRLSRNFQIPASSNIRWTCSEAYVPVPVGDEFTDNASENRMSGLQRPQPAYGVYYID